MRLTEQQLAALFQNETKGKQTKVMPSDCLNAMPASQNRLSQAEALLDDHTAAQSFKALPAFSKWADNVAHSIHHQKKSWVSLLNFSNPMKTAAATMALAVAFIVATPEFSDTSPVVPTNNDYASDVIKSMPFEKDKDILSNSSFETKTNGNNPDALFNANFG